MSDQHVPERRPSEDVTQELMRRIQDDPEFRAQVENDPIEVLSAAGIPEGSIGSFLREVGIEPEVSGYNFFPTTYPSILNSDPTDPGGGLPA